MNVSFFILCTRVGSHPGQTASSVALTGSQEG